METSGRAKERARLPEGAERSCRSYLVVLPVVICLSHRVSLTGAVHLTRCNAGVLR